MAICISTPDSVVAAVVVSTAVVLSELTVTVAVVAVAVVALAVAAVAVTVAAVAVTGTSSVTECICTVMVAAGTTVLASTRATAFTGLGEW